MEEESRRGTKMIARGFQNESFRSQNKLLQQQSLIIFSLSTQREAAAVAAIIGTFVTG